MYVHRPAVGTTALAVLLAQTPVQSNGVLLDILSEACVGLGKTGEGRTRLANADYSTTQVPPSEVAMLQLSLQSAVQCSEGHKSTRHRLAPCKFQGLSAWREMQCRRGSQVFSLVAFQA